MVKRARVAPLARRRAKSLKALLPNVVIVTDPKKLTRLKAEAERQKQIANGNPETGLGLNLTQGCARRIFHSLKAIELPHYRENSSGKI